MGQFVSPSTEGYSLLIEYKPNGVYKKYKNGKKVSKMTFRFLHGTSIYSADATYLIEYSDGPRNKVRRGADSFRFGGPDTLFLFNECYDCFVEVYVRKAP